MRIPLLVLRLSLQINDDAVALEGKHRDSHVAEELAKVEDLHRPWHCMTGRKFIREIANQQKASKKGASDASHGHIGKIGVGLQKTQGYGDEEHEEFVECLFAAHLRFLTNDLIEDISHEVKIADATAELDNEHKGDDCIFPVLSMYSLSQVGIRLNFLCFSVQIFLL